MGYASPGSMLWPFIGRNLVDPRQAVSPLRSPPDLHPSWRTLCMHKNTVCGSFMCWGLAPHAHRSIWGLVSPLFLLDIGLRCRPHRTSMQYRGRRIKDLRGGHDPASSYSISHFIHLREHVEHSTIPQQPEPATTRWGVRPATANVVILLLSA